jgi:hypothetical protein
VEALGHLLGVQAFVIGKHIDEGNCKHSIYEIMQEVFTEETKRGLENGKDRE